MRGHLNITNKTDVLEYNETGSDNTLNQVYLEIDADKYSAYLNVYFFYKHLNKSKIYAPNDDETTLVYIFLTAQYELLYLMSNKEDKTSSHPDFMTRSILYSHHIIQAHKVAKNKINISEKQIYISSLKAFVEFIKRHDIKYFNHKGRDVELLRKYEIYRKKIS